MSSENILWDKLHALEERTTILEFEDKTIYNHLETLKNNYETSRNTFIEKQEMHSQKVELIKSKLTDALSGLRIEFERLVSLVEGAFIAIKYGLTGLSILVTAAWTIFTFFHK